MRKSFLDYVRKQTKKKFIKSRKMGKILNVKFDIKHAFHHLSEQEARKTLKLAKKVKIGKLSE